MPFCMIPTARKWNKFLSSSPWCHADAKRTIRRYCVQCWSWLPCWPRRRWSLTLKMPSGEQLPMLYQMLLYMDSTSISARPFSDRLANLARNEPTANRASSRTTSNFCLPCHICQRSILGPRSTGSLKEPMTLWNPWSHMSTNSGSTSSLQGTGACTARQRARTMTLKVGTTDSTWRPALPTWTSMCSCNYWRVSPTWCHCSVNCWRRTRLRNGSLSRLRQPRASFGSSGNNTGNGTSAPTSSSNNLDTWQLQLKSRSDTLPNPAFSGTYGFPA